MLHARHSPHPQDLVDSPSTLPYGVPTVYHRPSQPPPPGASVRETDSPAVSASPPDRHHDCDEKSSLRLSLIRMASKTTPCQLVETDSAARHGTRLMASGWAFPFVPLTRSGIPLSAPPAPQDAVLYECGWAGLLFLVGAMER
jgi:hypothetical protein